MVWVDVGRDSGAELVHDFIDHGTHSVIRGHGPAGGKYPAGTQAWERMFSRGDVSVFDERCAVEEGNAEVEDFIVGPGRDEWC